MHTPSTHKSTRFLALFFAMALFWTCADPCESCKKCDDVLPPEQKEVFYSGTLFRFHGVDSLQYQHQRDTRVIIEGKLIQPDQNPLLLYISDKDKLIVQHSAINLNEVIEIEVDENADHLISMSLPFKYLSTNSCANGEPKVRISGTLVFEDTVNHEDVYVFDVANPSNRREVNANFGFEISLMRQPDNSCKVSLGIAYEVQSKSYVQKSTFGNIKDLGDLTVVLGDRVREVDMVRTPGGGR